MMRDEVSPSSFQGIIMHAVVFVEMAAFWAQHSASIFAARKPFSLPALNAYWVASRQRSDLWHESLWDYRHRLEQGGAAQRLVIWHQIRGIIEEVLLSEVMTRVLAAIALQLEQAGCDEDAAPITLSVSQNHAEARQRCLQVMVEAVGQPVMDAVQLNRLRFQMEEWTDLLLANLGAHPGALQQCHRPSRVKEWSEDVVVGQDEPTRQLAIQVRWMGLKRWLYRMHAERNPHPYLNQAVAKSVLRMMHREWFDSFGELLSTSAHYVRSVVAEKEGWSFPVLQPHGKGSLEEGGAMSRYQGLQSDPPFDDEF